MALVHNGPGRNGQGQKISEIVPVQNGLVDPRDSGSESQSEIVLVKNGLDPSQSKMKNGSQSVLLV